MQLISQRTRLFQIEIANKVNRKLFSLGDYFIIRRSVLKGTHTLFYNLNTYDSNVLIINLFTMHSFGNRHVLNSILQLMD